MKIDIGGKQQAVTTAFVSAIYVTERERKKHLKQQQNKMKESKNKPRGDVRIKFVKCRPV